MDQYYKSHIEITLTLCQNISKNALTLCRNTIKNALTLCIYKGRIYPIEVKSGSTGRLRSLHSYIDNSDCTCAIRLYSGKFSIDELKTPIVNGIGGKKFRLLNLPLYCTAKINEYIDEFL